MKNILMLLTLLLGTQIHAQNCNHKNHSNNINDSWLSCEASINPNPLRGASHWVMYDLGYVYRLGTTHFWNYNVQDETAKGMQNIIIDVSLNGNDWSEVGRFQLNEATGRSDYQGEEGLHLGGVDARFVLITAVDTWGDGCAGLSEVRFDIGGTVAVTNMESEPYAISLFPNPAMQRIAVSTNWEIKEMVIIDASGQEVARQAFTQHIDISYLPNGIYFLKSINHANESLTTKFIKQRN